VSTRLAVMDEGRVVQTGRPRDIYESPRSRFVARFVGAANLLEGHVVGRDGENLTVDCGAAGIVRVPDEGQLAAGRSVAVVVRPEKIALVSADAPLATAGGFNRLDVRVLDVAYQGGASTYHVEAQGGLRLRVEAANRDRRDTSALTPGAPVVAVWPAAAGVAVVE
jgi:ABC-type Fe3+/spermidine/putrescine transport system ATPase subunit